MAVQVEMRKRIASLTSVILHPLLLMLVMLFLLSFASAPSTLDAIKWTLISVALTILPVLLSLVYLVHSGRLDSIFTIIRRQRTKVYLLAGLCTIVGCVVLNYLGAPSILMAAFATGLSTTLIFMFINLRWKISLHTALVGALVTVLVILYGWLALVTATLVPLTVWARIELNHHSLAQGATGALLAALIVVAVFYPLVLLA